MGCLTKKNAEHQDVIVLTISSKLLWSVVMRREGRERISTSPASGENSITGGTLNLTNAQVKEQHLHCPFSQRSIRSATLRLNSCSVSSCAVVETNSEDTRIERWSMADDSNGLKAVSVNHQLKLKEISQRNQIIPLYHFSRGNKFIACPPFCAAGLDRHITFDRSPSKTDSYMFTSDLCMTLLESR